MILRSTLLALAVTAAWAQGDNPFNRPPADVDQALRARIQAFFQYHVTGEFRKAEALVAEDTKDYFYDHNKPKYLGFEINKIEYSDHFTKAKAMVVCETRINNPAFGNQIFKVPIPSSWKLEDGKWVWWVDPESRNLTPFGKMTPGPEPKTANGTAPVMPSPEQIANSPDFLFKQVKLDKTSLELKQGGSGTVVVNNGAPGLVTVTVVEAPKGISTKLSLEALNAGDKSTVTVKAGEGAQSGELQLQIGPIGQILKVQITVK